MVKKVFSALFTTIFVLGMHSWVLAQTGAPTVNGLFYGDGDDARYSLYSTAASGSKLYFNVTNDVLYVALVVDRSVNDIVFDSGNSGYMTSAGWSGGNINACRRIDSEFAEFTLEVSGVSTTWRQGLAGQTDQNSSGNPCTRYDRSSNTWFSDETVSGGSGTPPSSYNSSSSFVYNMNSYAEGNNNWTMPGSDTNADTWKSPWKNAGTASEDPNTIIDANEGYPSTGPLTYSETYDWEWSMVYEWSVDLSEYSSTSNPIFILSGASHHSPSKNGDEDDPFVDNDLLGAIGNFVWQDSNRNGVQDSGEPGAANVTVNLFEDGNSSPIATTTTNADGFYLFSELDAGTYSVEFELPSGFDFTAQSAGSDNEVDSNPNINSGITPSINLAAGEIRLDVDAGLVESLTSCPVYLLGPVRDADGITWNAIVKGDWTTSGADSEGRLAIGGNFTVNGAYAIGFGNTQNQLPQSNGSRDDLIVGGNFANNSTNWQIQNGNAVYGGSFSGTAPSFGGTGNQLISDPNRFDFDEAFNQFEDISQSLAFLPQNGTVNDNGSGGLTLNGSDPDLNVFEITSSMQRSNGGFELTINVPSTSSVVINVPDETFTFTAGSFQTDIRERVILNFPNATEVNVTSFAVLGSILAPYADFNGSGGNVNGHMIIGGDVTQTGGFEPHYYPFTGCIEPTGAVGNYVWLDENSNGIQDDGEPGVENVFVTLLDGNENFIATTQTDADGFYLFNGLDAGTYIVNFELPSTDFDFTLKEQGSDSELDSDVNFSTGNTDPFTLQTAQVRLDIDAGLEEQIETSEITSLIVTEGSCWRMFSSPFQTKRTFTDGVPDDGSVSDFTYNDFVGPWWTQGPVGSGNPDLNASNANIFVWPLDAAGNSDTDWSIDFGTNGLNEQVTAARGFLMSIFADDDPTDGIDNTWPAGDKERTFEYVNADVWGFDSNNPEVSTNISAPMNTTSDGWSLIGNPYDESVTFSQLTTSNITGVAYVYDRNLTGTGEEIDVGDNIGGWRTTSATDQYGDITNGVIEPFQGFFVQNSGTNGSVTFTDASKQGTGEFYGKQKERIFTRLELQGEGLFNSAWVAFSDDASFEQMYGDAFELNPFSEQYALLGALKGNDMFDIGQFPMEDGTEIPLAIETTLTGEYTLSATDFELPAGTELVFVDKDKGLKLPVDEDFSYTFTMNGVQQKGMGMDALPCGATQQQIADFFKPTKSKASGDSRFSLIVNPDGSLDENELPGDIQLKQNYPNPFNPTTQITYQLPQASDVQLAIYDMAGRQVTTLVNERMSSGSHTINFNASELSSGVYLYRLQAGSTVLTKKLTLIK
jgi:choice-of-anchor A domain-containing protein